MATKAEIWALVEPIAREVGVEVYDIEPPLSDSGDLRISIWKRKAAQPAAVKEEAVVAAEGKSSAGDSRVTLEECAKVSKRISALMESGAFFSSDLSIEVGSPGINRKLSRAEHYADAIGERVKLKVGGNSAVSVMALSKKEDEQSSGGDLRNAGITGKLISFDGSKLEVEEERSSTVVSIELSDVRHGRIDFKF